MTTLFLCLKPKLVILNKLAGNFIQKNIFLMICLPDKILSMLQGCLITLHGCRRHVRTGQLGAFIIMFTENLKQGTLYGSILSPKTVQDTTGRNRYTFYFQFTLNFHYPQTDRVKIQIQFLVLTLLFQGLSFCRTPEFRKNCFLH